MTSADFSSFIKKINDISYVNDLSWSTQKSNKTKANHHKRTASVKKWQTMKITII